MSDNLPNKPQQSEEVDLRQLFKLIGNAFDRFFKFIGSIFNKLFLAFVWLVFFAKKHIVKVMIAGVLGLILGYILDTVPEPVYKSEVIIKQNYNTGESLNSTINYYNTLLQEGNFSALSESLDINEESTISIVGFEMESIVTENQKLKQYNEYISSLDSMVAAKFVTYESYIEQLKSYNQPIQKIIVKSKARTNFNSVFNKIIGQINANEYFLREQQKDTLQIIGERKAINEALVKSVDLQNIYTALLDKAYQNRQEKPNAQTTITIDNTDNRTKTNEFELYKSDNDLRQQLVINERQLANKKFILEVLSTSQDEGTLSINKIDVFGISLSLKVFYGIFFAFVAFVILLGLEFIKFLEKFKVSI